MKHLLLFLIFALMPAIPSAEPAELALEDLDGVEHKLSDYRGKWVLVNYWATWCPPCLEEMPDLELFHNERKDEDAVVLGVNHEFATVEELKAFADDMFISFPLLRSRPDHDGINGPLRGLPTSYLVNPEGEIVAEQIGMVSREAIESFIDNYEQP